MPSLVGHSVGRNDAGQRARGLAVDARLRPGRPHLGTALWRGRLESSTPWSAASERCSVRSTRARARNRTTDACCALRRAVTQARVHRLPCEHRFAGGHRVDRVAPSQTLRSSQVTQWDSAGADDFRAFPVRRAARPTLGGGRRVAARSGTAASPPRPSDLRIRRPSERCAARGMQPVRAQPALRNQLWRTGSTTPNRHACRCESVGVPSLRVESSRDRGGAYAAAVAGLAIRTASIGRVTTSTKTQDLDPRQLRQRHARLGDELPERLVELVGRLEVAQVSGPFDDHQRGARNLLRYRRGAVGWYQRVSA